MGYEVLMKVHMKEQGEGLERTIGRIEDELEVRAVREPGIFAWDGIFGPAIYLGPEKLEIDGAKVTEVTFRLPHSKYVPEGGLEYDEFERQIYDLHAKADEVIGQRIGEDKCSFERVLGPWCWGQGVVYTVPGARTESECKGKAYRHYEFED